MGFNEVRFVSLQCTRQSVGTATAWRDRSSWRAGLYRWRGRRSDAATPCPPTWGTLGCWGRPTQRRGRLQVTHCSCRLVETTQLLRIEALIIAILEHQSFTLNVGGVWYYQHDHHQCWCNLTLLTTHRRLSSRVLWHVCLQVGHQMPAWFGSSVGIITGSLWPTLSLSSATGKHAHQLIKVRLQI